MDEFIKFIAENWENEQEYAGRMETWCNYCGKYQGERYGHAGVEATHEENCLHLKALAIVETATKL